MKPMVMAVTGGIGSGKTGVAKLLADECSAAYIDLDGLCRGLLQPGGAGVEVLRDLFGNRFVDPAGQVDRKHLREAVFADASLRRRVDAGLHPLAARSLVQELEHCGKALAVVEVPLLFEAGWQGIADRIVVVWAPEEERIRRILLRDHVSAEQARAAIAAQMDLRDKILCSDHLIDNGAGWKETEAQVVDLAKWLAANGFLPE